MATLLAGYIPQHKVPSASSSRSIGFSVCVQCCRMVDSVKFGHSEKGTKFEKIFHLKFDATELKVEDFFKFFALLRTSKLY